MNPKDTSVPFKIQIPQGSLLVGVVRTVNRLVHFVIVLWLTLTYLNYLLSLFPWTYGIASKIFEMAAGPLKAFGKALVSLAPSFFFLAFIIAVTVFTLRGIKFVFNEIARGKISIRGF